MDSSSEFVERMKDGAYRLGNASFEMLLRRDAWGAPIVARWVNRAQPDNDWATGAVIAPTIIVGNRTYLGGSADMPCTDIAVEVSAGRLCLCFACADGLLVKNYLQPAHKQAVVLTWTELACSGPSEVAEISRFDALNLVLRASGEQPWASYLTGWLWGPRAEAPGRPTQPFAYPSWIPRLLYGDGAPPPPPPPAGGWASSILRLIKEPITVLPLRSGKRSTYDNHPWCVVRDARRHGGCFLALEWSGTWEMNLEYKLDAQAVTIQTATAGETHRLAPGRTLQTPRAFIGLFAGDWDDAYNACRRHVRDEILPSVELDYPPVQDNVGTPNETNKLDRIYREIDLAHQAGYELITIDAQWWAGSSHTGEFSWGLGSFTDDRTKFPQGLRAISDYIHSLGMQFGLWFEFSRVDLRTANQGHHPWNPAMLLHRDGQSYRSWCQHVYMMCTGATGAADWALENMAWCVREFNIDYIKIDDNEWAVCQDDTHGHDAGDGEWQQIQGVYHILCGLRERFPNLVIENCAGGSQRADLGMARYCVPIQVHDRCYPSVLERRYAHAIGSLYPQFAPLLALAPAPESVAQLRWRALARMMGQFNCGLQDRLSPELFEEMKRCIATYKRLRPTLHGDRYVLAEPAIVLEPDVPEATNWEVYEYLSPAADLISLFCFRCESPDDSYRAVLKGLQAGASYRVSSHAGDDLGVFSGAQLMREGQVCSLPGRRNAEVFILARQ
jgi:alpha-galactosidase